MTASYNYVSQFVKYIFELFSYLAEDWSAQPATEDWSAAPTAQASDWGGATADWSQIMNLGDNNKTAF